MIEEKKSLNYRKVKTCNDCMYCDIQRRDTGEYSEKFELELYCFKFKGVVSILGMCDEFKEKLGGGAE